MGKSKKEKKVKEVEKEEEGFELSPEVYLRLVSLISILVAPLTKVEESFNLQAIHDILFHRGDLEKYDHLDFPGVVPRTFIGPMIVAGLSTPIVLVAQQFFTKYVVQIIVRCCLSELVIRAFQIFREGITKEFGKPAGLWLVAITASQFHFIFYMGRTLPNIMALPGALLAIHYWMKGEHPKFIMMSAFSAVIFRAELALLFGILLLIELFSRRLSILKAILYGAVCGFLCLGWTVTIDTIFWRRTLWPEGEVLWFNTVENQSHKWGTYPFLWYFYSALPRALASSTVLVPVGLYLSPRVRTLVIPCLIFVFFYSFLPHKELRFIIYVIPVLNVAAAVACDILWKKRAKNILWALMCVGLIFHIVLNGVLSTAMLIVSSKNYPGGNALIKLHQLEHMSSPINVHIDVHSAQTGVSRFLELSPYWKYNKTEGLTRGGQEILQFSHLLVEAEDVEERLAYFKSHEILVSEEGYAGIDFLWNRVPPVSIKTEPKVLVLRKNKSAVS
ncbi:putative Dol-P-Man:Man(7)GlcNAc(2)-PP-Dol alpha-1,6-mannosyltransferase [Orchesella cincta]|uniref:Mannosyltransferase n=1 Tax=Orchesella cincta TaxID=48709 RepID=A0A1D2NBA8_ORCCI|nr:putative Dol-P-Man:Man(7)GlcNAc(2)-PP-Dol alpha-1,6-mannosyltransferase [Orchesella cincta]